MNANAAYEHRQYLAIWTFVMIAGIVAYSAGLWLTVKHENPGEAGISGLIVVVVSTILLAVLSMIAYMSTRVDSRGVSWSFVWGYPGGHIRLAEIAGARPSMVGLIDRIHPLWDWHRRIQLVAGSRAVEIVKTNGDRFLLGTDDPQGLAEAIERFRRGAA